MQTFDRFWWNLARWRILVPYSVKILNFWKFKMAAAAILKITKIAISLQRFDRSLRNLVCWCKMGLLTVPTVKNFEFHKSKMADGRHFEKSDKSPYLCDRSIDFDEIWQDDACRPLAANQSLKFGIFENPRWRRPPSWKITKIAISPQWFDRSLRNLVLWCKMGLLTSPTVKKIWISQIQDGRRPPFWKPLNCHISAPPHAN